MATFKGLCIGGPKNNQALTATRDRVFVSEPLPLPSPRGPPVYLRNLSTVVGYYELHPNGRWYWNPS